VSDALWRAVDELLDGAQVDGIRANMLGALAAQLRRRAGESVPSLLAEDERDAAVAVTTARPLLEHVRSVCDGPLVLVKGLEIARLYPGSARTFSDVDLLAADADAAQRALVAAGYIELGGPHYFVHHHHLRPLKSPRVGLTVEIHTSPPWPPGTLPPPLAEILDRFAVGGVDVEGIAAPDPIHHAVILAAHAWRHEPLRTLRDLVDVAAVSSGCSEAELAHTAEAWGIPKIWRTTRAAIAALVEDGPTTLPLRTWARHLRCVRERTLLERHLTQWLHAFWELPPRAAAGDLGAAFRLTLIPAPGEPWRDKLARTGHSFRHLGDPMSTHLMWSQEADRRRSGS
jgi:Uncharacterised nucleotidyltransferase